jgi:hypothetical protein
MIKFFGKSYVNRLLAVFIIGLVYRIPCFFYEKTSAENIAYNSTLADLLNLNNFFYHDINVLITFVVIYVTGILINAVAVKYQLVERNSSLPLLIYIVLSSLSPQQMMMSSFVFIGIPVVLMFDMLFKHDRTLDNIFLSFNAGFVAGIMVIIFYPAFWLIFFIWLVFLILKGVAWRNYVVATIGVLLPLFFDYEFNFFTGKEFLFISIMSQIFNFHEFKLQALNELYYIISIFYVLMIVLSLMILNTTENLKISQRKLFYVIGVYILFAVAIILFYPVSNNVFLLLPPSAILLTHYISKLPDTKKVNFVFFLILLLIFVNNWMICIK